MLPAIGGIPPHPALARGPVSLDCDATTPVDPRVAEAMLPHLPDFLANPSSSPLLRGAASSARRGPHPGRRLLGARPGEIVFTASGSETDLLALRGAVMASGRCART
ncbi:hypothetical protein [Streptomyces sp. NRRL F-5727]|uniref:hypothetical protein n=1 Tax=Streptomyces sp. NRRL F-5727 TaxID=1463871 RepID=UPI000689913E|nr:hypothetical protein [Streptomyces sp. NRRL F-5727]